MKKHQLSIIESSRAEICSKFYTIPGLKDKVNAANLSYDLWFEICDGASIYAVSVFNLDSDGKPVTTESVFKKDVIKQLKSRRPSVVPFVQQAFGPKSK
jgi:hypothetical protein